jgi:phage terminase large subunit
MAELNVEFKMPAKLVPVFTGPARVRGAYGGRGSGKSTTFAQQLLKRSLEKRTRILCTREFQNSIKDSVIQLLIDSAEELGIQQFFDYGDSYFRCKLWNEEFIFKGLRRNIKEIKSLEGIDICWIEEAEQTSRESLKILIPTIRAPGSEIWLTWNPESEDAPVRHDYVLAEPDPMVKVAEINYVDNPWFPAELDYERRKAQKGDPDLYAHVWLGQCLTRTDAQVLAGKWRVDTFTMPDEVDGGPYYGVDWGFGSDPLAVVRCWVKDNVLFIDYEAGGHGIEIKNTAAEFDKVPGLRSHIVRADNARPELINHMQTEEGFRIVAADKWPGSIEDGITHLRSYDEIVIHERCVEVAREARLWSYKTDKQTGDVLPILLDANNHYFDGTRYALAPIIRKKNFTGKAVYGGQYNQQLHVSHEELWPIKGVPIFVGIAAKQTTVAMVIGQLSRTGQLRIIEEVIRREIGIGQFAKTVLVPALASKYRGRPYTVVTFMDRTTAGSRKTDTESRLMQDEMDEAGVEVESVSSDLLHRRLEAVRWYLGQLHGGAPAISISPTCQTLIDGFLGGYQFKRLEMQGSDDIRFTTDPDQNQYVLPHEALQYLCMWLREDFDNNRSTPVVEVKAYQ